MKTAVEYLFDKLFDPSTMVDEQLYWLQEAKELENEQKLQFAEDYHERTLINVYNSIYKKNNKLNQNDTKRKSRRLGKSI